MKSPLALPFLLGLASAIAVSQKVSYADYRVVRVKNSAEVEQLIKQHSLATWEKQNGNVDVVIPPGVTALDGLETLVMHDNLGESIAKEADYDTYEAGSANATWFNSYHAYADHLQFLSDLQSAHPANSEIISIGNSLQGRPITGIHFYGASGKGSKPAIVIHGTVHAREWIATLVTEYFAYNLLTNYTTNSEIKGFVDNYDFYVFPVVNPDGALPNPLYVYTNLTISIGFLYSQTTDRLWRKNRQTTTGSSCVGHDINRNWPYMWSVPGGASTDPCADDFKGISQGDAPENQVLSAYVNKLAATTAGLQLYIDYHSYSQLFMTPYGYSCTVVAPANNKLQALAKGAAAAIKAVYGTVFQYGPICTTIYQATGSSVDYVNDVSKAKYTFTSELRDTGNYGFVLPAKQILPSGVEAYAGFRYILLNM